MRKETVLKTFRDVFKAILLGMLVSLGLSIAGFLIALLFGPVPTALDAARSVACFLVAVAIFILAGMLMLRGKKEQKIDTQHGWRKHFKVIGAKTAIACFSLGLVLAVSLIDLITRAV